MPRWNILLGTDCSKEPRFKLQSNIMLVLVSALRKSHRDAMPCEHLSRQNEYVQGSITRVSASTVSVTIARLCRHVDLGAKSISHDFIGIYRQEQNLTTMYQTQTLLQMRQTTTFTTRATMTIRPRTHSSPLMTCQQKIATSLPFVPSSSAFSAVRSSMPPTSIWV